jgi:flagellar biosynthesis anti-sigma factor FlgM
MRINPNQGSQPVPESGQSGNSRSVTSNPRSSAGNPLGEDQAQLSDAHAQVQALAAQVMQFPEVQQEKVTALRDVVQTGSYQPGPAKVAGALFDHMVKPAA